MIKIHEDGLKIEKSPFLKPVLADPSESNEFQPCTDASFCGLAATLLQEGRHLPMFERN